LPTLKYIETPIDYKMRILICGLFFTLTASFCTAQKHFAEPCEGVWHGTLYMYSYGKLKDSVEVTLTVKKTNDAEIYTWKTDYLSAKWPITKDYLLKRVDKEKGIYETDEQNGVVLKNYLVGNKLYSVFETEGIFLTSCYELHKEYLYFEVTSGKKINTTQGVINIATEHVQKVYLKKK
jgi:hypothetical protein